MKDFPVFTTEYGVASLILKEIPYRKEAYIHIRDSAEPEQFLSECVSFCRACGAEKIYAAGHPYLDHFPIHTSVIEMGGYPTVDPEKIEYLWPVTEETVTQWREIHNKRMTEVDNAGTLESKEEAKIISSGGAYFIHHEGELLGIGWLEDCRILAIASVKPGAGERVLHSLLSVCPGERYTLEVASTNRRAIALYERNGFLPIREISQWYRV